MTPMNAELLEAVRAAEGVPIRVVDPDTNTEYVIVRADAFDRLKVLLTDGDLEETYPAQIESAMRAGWDDPTMDDYNDYERFRHR
ncbi:MAG TPA: hypothetical protein VMV69_26675 [Pirellulales bacterium]|nr:hypothetical protein [Pirellulales bacterium]